MNNPNYQYAMPYPNQNYQPNQVEPQMYPTQPLKPGQISDFEESYIENILRLNKGKVGTFYMTYNDSLEYRDKVYRGIIQAAGKDHIVISDNRYGTCSRFPCPDTADTGRWAPGTDPDRRSRRPSAWCSRRRTG